MANWKHKLDISDDWKKAQANGITPQELAKRILTKLKEIPTFEKDEELQEAALRFEECAEEPGIAWDDIDNAMYYLYEWADTTLDNEWPPAKNCWVTTLI